MRKMAISKVTATVFIVFLSITILSTHSPSMEVFSTVSDEESKASASVILRIRPNGDGKYTEWDPFPVLNPRWTCLNEVIQNGDDDFVYTMLDGKRNFCNLPNHGSIWGKILNVKVVVWAKRADVLAGDVTIGLIVCGSALYEGETFSISETYAKYESDWPTNPDTGADWAWSAIDTLQAGFESVQVGVSPTIWRVTQLYVDITYEYSAEDDDSRLEVLVEWINDYPGTEHDVEGRDDSAEGLREKLSSIGWEWHWWNYDGDEYRACSDSLAWEQDFDEEEEDWVDDVDIAFFAGHGSKAYDWNFGKDLHTLYFSTEHDDEHLKPGDAYGEWGNRDLEWIAFDACKVLKDDHGNYWASTMDGVHLILGFKTTALDHRIGYWWALGMVSEGCYDPPMRIAAAWCWAAHKTQSGDKVKTRVLGETEETFEDYLWGQGYVSEDNPPVDDTYWYLDQSITTNPHVIQIEPPFPDQMNLYIVDPTPVNVTYVESIGSIFGLTGEVGYYGDGIYYMTDGVKYLQVSITEGILYGDSSKLWVIHDTEPELPTKEQAEFEAQNFLSNNGLLPTDTSLHDTYSSEQGCVNKTGGTLINSTIIDRQVEYVRSIDGYSVVGPGAKLEVFIGENNETIGFFRVLRPVQYAETIDIISEEEAVNILDAYGGKVMLGGAPLSPWDEMNITSTTLGYYEAGFNETQEYLIPCYIFNVDFMLEGNVTFTGLICTPATSGFLPPIAEIVSPSNDYVSSEGQPISFVGQCSDFGTPPFTYEWYSNIDGHLGEGPELIISTLSVGRKEGTGVPHTITLTVIDSTGKSSSAYIAVTVKRAVGGIVVAVDKLSLLAPYIGLTSTIVVAAVSAAIYVKRIRHRKEKE